MSLLLGRVGRKILDYAVRNPDSALIRLSRSAGRVLHGVSGHYTVGLSVETYGLWKALQDKGIKKGTVKVAKDGFYVGGKKLAGDESVSAAFLAKRIDQIDVAEITSPEKLANIPRERTFMLMNRVLNLSFVILCFTYSSLLLAGFSLGGYIGCRIAEKIKNRDLKDNPRPGLIDVERFSCPVYTIPIDIGLKAGFASLDLQAAIFFRLSGLVGRTFGYSYESKVNHEKAHLLGASEVEAYDLQNVLDLKRFFSGKTGIGSFLVACASSMMFFPTIALTSLRYMISYKHSFFRYFDHYALVKLREDEANVREALARELRDAAEFEAQYARNDLPKGDRVLLFEDILATYQELVEIYTVLGDKDNAYSAWAKLLDYHLSASSDPRYTPKQQKNYAYRGKYHGILAVLRGLIDNNHGKARQYYAQLKALEQISPDEMQKDSVYGALRDHISKQFECQG